jgi:hypothetical protein
LAVLVVAQIQQEERQTLLQIQPAQVGTVYLQALPELQLVALVVAAVELEATQPLELAVLVVVAQVAL